MGKKDELARKFLELGVLAAGGGLLLLAISASLGLSSNPALLAVSQGLRLPAPYAFLVGVVLVVLYFVARPKPDSAPSRMDPTLFGKDTTAFASQLDSRLATQAGDLEPLHRGQRPRAATWNAQVFRDIEWRRFEEVCASLFAQAGFEARTQSHGADGGVDIWLYSANAQGPAAVVQCKHWLSKPVSVKEVREFYGVMASHKLTRGTFATSGTFTADARDFAKSNGISPMDGLALLALISRRTTQQQKDLLELAYEGEYWRPTCASCGIKMVERHARRKGSAFWGCAEYPRCSFTLPVRSA